MLNVLWRNRSLIKQLTRRQIASRYRGSYLGMVWPFLTPLLMLAIYTYLLSGVFHARWSEQTSDSHLEFGLMLFAGLVPFGVFSESVGGAPGLVVSYPNYVKKVRFPLEILPVTLVAAAVVHSVFSLAVLAAALVIVWRTIPPTFLLLPVAYLPLVLLSLGFAWFLASIGVFVRDVGQVVGVVVQALFFLTPILYPASAIPAGIRPLLLLNPLAPIVGAFRDVTLLGRSPDWFGMTLVTAVSLLVCVGGFRWFARSKHAFGDVI